VGVESSNPMAVVVLLGPRIQLAFREPEKSMRNIKSSARRYLYFARGRDNLFPLARTGLYLRAITPPQVHIRCVPSAYPAHKPKSRTCLRAGKRGGGQKASELHHWGVPRLASAHERTDGQFTSTDLMVPTAESH